MKRFMVLLLAAAAMLSLCACDSSTSSGKLPGKPSDTYIGGNPEQPGKETEETTPSHTEDPNADIDETPPTETQPIARADVPGQQFSNDGGTSIDVIREEITQAGSAFGLCYIGYYEYYEETGIDFGQWYDSAASPFVAYYPFLSEIDADHTIGESGHLYCIIGREYADSITITDQDGQTLYSASNGDPILIFCDHGGDGRTADLTVTIASADGVVYTYVPILDELNYPQILVGDERQLLSWDFTYLADMGFDPTGWLNEGWIGPTEAGLAGTDVFEGMSWWVRTTDGTRIRYCLNFYPNAAHSYDGEVTLECFYDDTDTVQAQWQGWWNLDTVMDNASLLHMDLMLMNGADMGAFEACSVISEDYRVLVAPSGEELLLVADATQPMLPLLPDGWGFTTLSLSMG